MAKGKTMLQVDGVFGVAPNVQSEMPSAVFAWVWLDGKPNTKTTVREVSAQQAYFTGFSGPSGSGISAIATGGEAFAMLTLIVDASRGHHTIKALKNEWITFGRKYYFNSPSFNDSPDVYAVDLAFLAVRMPSWSVLSPWKIKSAKRIGGHAYFDEVFVPPPPLEMAPSPKTKVDSGFKKITKSTSSQKSKGITGDMAVEFGPGELVVGLADSGGTALSEVRLRVSGHSDARGSTILPLSLQTDKGLVDVTPTLITRSSPDQVVTFDNVESRVFIKKRAKKIGCSTTVARRLERGNVRQRLDEETRFHSF